ncbi:MAG: hypothetical protein M0002_01875, partial [Rhodospirillales bacterium]|nr:hypothetical protein [Rhodospirillales bacterium]
MVPNEATKFALYRAMRPIGGRHGLRLAVDELPYLPLRLVSGQELRHRHPDRNLERCGHGRNLYPDSMKIRILPLAKWLGLDSTERDGSAWLPGRRISARLIELARDGPAAHRLARRANALVLPDDGM